MARSISSRPELGKVSQSALTIWICVAPLLLALQGAGARRGARLGFTFGLAYFALLLYWISIIGVIGLLWGSSAFYGVLDEVMRRIAQGSATRNEDEDFSFRLSRTGRIRYEPSLVVHHDNAGFAGSATRAPQQTEE